MGADSGYLVLRPKRPTRSFELSLRNRCWLPTSNQLRIRRKLRSKEWSRSRLFIPRKDSKFVHRPLLIICCGLTRCTSQWPVVFVPCVEATVYPFYKCTAPHEVDEERRLLFVAITRAKVFCFISHAQSRRLGAKKAERERSSFLSIASTFPTLFVDKLQLISAKTRIEVAKVLGRPTAAEAEVTRCVIANKREAAKLLQKQNQEERELLERISQRTNKANPTFRSQPTPANAGFSSALSVHQKVDPVKPLAPFQPYSASSAPVASTSVQPYSSTSFKPHSSIPRTTAPMSQFGVAETRQSLINQSVLLNPIAAAPFSLNTLLASQQNQLATMRNLGAPSANSLPPVATLMESTNSIDSAMEKRKAEVVAEERVVRPKRVAKPKKK